MSVSLACTWQPHGELPRLQRLMPLLRRTYQGIALALPPDVGSDELVAVQKTPGLRVLVTSNWTLGVCTAIQASLENGCSHVHYADLDRLIRWAETRPEELRHTVEEIQRVDCLIIGRTEAAYHTHPEAMQRTEQVVNSVISHLLGQTADICAGSRGFSRPAIDFLMANSELGHWKDGEWPVLLHRAGYIVSYLAVNGLDWETPDRYLPQAADADAQRRMAEQYDRVAGNWALRVQVAREIIEAGLAAAWRQFP